MRPIASCLLSFVLVGVCMGPVASQGAKPPELIFDPWIKFCLTGTCYVSAGVRTECAPVARVTLMEKEGEAKRTLRVMLPAHVNLERGLRIVIGQSQPITGSYSGCMRGSCRADYEAGGDLVDRLKQGSALVLEGTNTADLPVRVSLSLADFAKAYDGQPHDPVVVEMLHRSQKEIEELNAAEAARKARCEHAAPLP